MITLIESLGVGAFIISIINSYLLLKKHNMEKPKLILEKAYFRKVYHGLPKEKFPKEERNKEAIEVELNLRNLSIHPTTIEDISIQIGNFVQYPNEFKQINLSRGSKEISCILKFEGTDFKKFPGDDGLYDFVICVKSTFGHIKKRGKGHLETGHFHII